MAINNATNNKSYVFNSDTTITAGTGITATTGNIAASAGAVSASTTVTAGTNLVSTAGNLSLAATGAGPVGTIQWNSKTWAMSFAYNTFVGEEAGNIGATDPHGYNVALGWKALSAVTSGLYNVAIGQEALKLTTQGCYNVAFGGSSLYSATTGSFFNMAIGSSCLYSITSGSQNTAIGTIAGWLLTTGSYNVLIGGVSNPPTATTGTGSSYTGAESANILIGNMVTGTTGESHKIRIGTTGSGTGQQNDLWIAGTYTPTTAIGGTAKVMLVDSADHIGGLTNTTGALLHVAAAGTAPIWSTGPTVTTLYATTFDTNVAAAAVTLAGTTLAADGSDTDISITITPKGAGVLSTGNITSTAVYAKAVGGTNRAMLVDDTGIIGNATSSIRFKYNVKDMGHRSDDLMKLRPVTFSYKSDESKRENFGLIAEEVAQVYPGLVSYDENNEPYTVSYHELPALLLNEIQKLHKKIEQLEARLNLQQKGE